MTIAQRGPGIEGVDITIGGYYGCVRGVDVAAIQIWIRHPSGVDVLLALSPRDATGLALKLIEKATEAIGHIGGDVTPKGGVQ